MRMRMGEVVTTFAPFGPSAGPPPRFASSAGVAFDQSLVSSFTITPVVTKPSVAAPKSGGAPASGTSADCGPEPARKQVGAIAPYVDAAAGAAWLKCKDVENAARQKAAFALMDQASDCGPEPPFNLASSGQKFYTDADLGAHWVACRAKIASAPVASQGSSVSTPVPIDRTATAAGASSPSSASSYSSTSTSAGAPAAAAAPVAAGSASAPVQLSLPSPPTASQTAFVAIGLGALIVVGGGLFLALR